MVSIASILVYPSSHVTFYRPKDNLPTRRADALLISFLIPSCRLFCQTGKQDLQRRIHRRRLPLHSAHRRKAHGPQLRRRSPLLPLARQEINTLNHIARL